MIVTLCLAAVDCILCRRYRWAFWLWWLAALGRPEAWAPMAIYIVWAWRAQPTMRRQMVAGILLIGVLWFGIPAVTSKSAFGAASLAEHSPREVRGNKITGTFSRFEALDATSIKLAALIAVVLAVIRRDRPVLGCWRAASCCGWWWRSRSRCTAGRRCRGTCSRRPAASACWRACSPAG